MKQNMVVVMTFFFRELQYQNFDNWMMMTTMIIVLITIYSSSSALQLWESLGFLNNFLPLHPFVEIL